MNNKLKIFLKGIQDVSPLMIPVVPFGIIFGVLAIELGFNGYTTMGMSIIIFGGASQIIFLQLFSAGASSLIILGSVGAVNSRHLLYGAVLSEHLSDLKLSWKIIISYFLVDQAFAVSNSYLKKNNDKNKHFHLFGAGVTCWTIWQITTFIGIILGYFMGKDIQPKYIIFWSVGFCGGFSTFSTFSNEVLQLIKLGQYALVFAYVVFSVTLGLVAIILGSKIF